MTSAEHQSFAGATKKGDLIAGKYRVEEVLGKGGMGVVVAAEDTVLRRRVAIKFLLPSAAEMPGAVERFLREARSASAIQSEHVTRVLDMGTQEGGVPYLVMEHLAGKDLGATLKQGGPFSIADATDIVLQACEALAEAHAKGIIHRDLKPANLFLTSRADGSMLVKVLDFGLSKALTDDDGHGPDVSLTATSAVIGSPQYMSPEQFRSAKTVDARTDIWAMGVILYVAISGKRPFDGDTFPEICMSIATETPLPLGAHRADIPKDLEAIVMHCLDKDKDARMQNVTELARAIAPFGGASSAISLERIEKVLPIAASARPSARGYVPSAAPARGSSSGSGNAPAVPAGFVRAEPESVNAFSGTQNRAPRRARPLIAIFVGIGALALGAIITVTVALLRAPVVAPPAPALAPTASIAPTPEAALLVSPSAEGPSPSISAVMTAPASPESASAPALSGTASAPLRPASRPTALPAKPVPSAGPTAPGKTYDKKDLSF